MNCAFGSAQRLESLEGRALFDAGRLDPFFGDAGEAVIDYPQGKPDVVDFAPAGDSSIFVAATITPTSGGPRSFGLAHYRNDGSIDTNFGDNGWVTTAVGTRDSIASGMIIQPDGKIVVVGAAVYPPQNPPHYFETIDVTDIALTEDRSFAIARYRPDGRLDRTFGRRGIVVADVGKVADFSQPLDISSYARDEAQDVIVQPDGKLVIWGVGGVGEQVDQSGSKIIVESTSFALLRLNGDGSPDTSFGTGQHGISFVGPVSSDSNDFDTVALDSAGRFVVVGRSSFTTFEGESRESRRLRRFTASGSLDSSFNEVSQSDQGLFFAAAVRRDDSIVVVGGEGLLTFDQHGSLIGSADDPTASLASDLAVDRDRKIVLISSETNKPVLRRIRADGRPDSTFGTNGRVVSSDAAVDFLARKLAISSDGSYLGLGTESNTSDSRGVLARFWRDEGPAAVLKVRNITMARSESQVLTVTYRDDEGIDITTLDNRDVRITSSNGSVRYAKLAAIGATADPRQRIVRYKLVAPGGSWDESDNGLYTVSLRSLQVSDTSSHFARTPTLGTFSVNINSQNVGELIPTAIPWGTEKSWNSPVAGEVLDFTA